MAFINNSYYAKLMITSQKDTIANLSTETQGKPFSTVNLIDLTPDTHWESKSEDILVDLSEIAETGNNSDVQPSPAVQIYLNNLTRVPEDNPVIQDLTPHPNVEPNYVCDYPVPLPDTKFTAPGDSFIAREPDTPLVNQDALSQINRTSTSTLYYPPTSKSVPLQKLIPADPLEYPKDNDPNNPTVGTSKESQNSKRNKSKKKNFHERAKKLAELIKDNPSRVKGLLASYPSNAKFVDAVASELRRLGIDFDA